MRCEGDVWLRRPGELFCSFDVVPVPSMSAASQINAVTRLAFLLGLVMAPFSWRRALLFFACSVVFATILFWTMIRNNEGYMGQAKKETTVVEMFEPVAVKEGGTVVEFYIPQCSDSQAACELNTQNPARVPEVFQRPKYGPDYHSPNQALVGGPAARTAIPPVLVPPIWSPEWVETPFVLMSGINEETNEDLSASGYTVSKGTLEHCGDYCGETACCGRDVARELLDASLVPKRRRELREDFDDVLSEIGTSAGEGVEAAIEPSYDRLPPEMLASDVDVAIDSPYPARPPLLPPYSYPNPQGEGCPTKLPPGHRDVSATYYPRPMPGGVLTTEGYHPEQIYENNLPSNVSFGECAKEAVFTPYNKELYTIPLEPGLSTRNQIREPISSNIGISFTQQFEPITCEKGCDGGVTYIGHDPHVVPDNLPSREQEIPYERQVHLADIYDPRFTGYGTSYRSYIEPVTGQPRFYYKDVDAHKRMSYVTRSDVDFLPSSLATQALPNNAYFNKQNDHSRAIANQAFTDNTVFFRTGLQERLMRKANANRAQSRLYPKHTNSFNRGGMTRK